jgi:DNA-3-methyladenine glycosylase
MAKAKKLGRRFYQQPADVLARALIGKILVHRVGNRKLRARIVEAEAYMGPADLASHSSKGRTRRTEVMFGPAGHAYIYFIYGMYEMFNIVAGTTGQAHAVLIRAAEPLDGWQADLTGPGKLATRLEIKRLDNGRDLTGPDLYLQDDGFIPTRILSGPRVNIDYAKEWVDKPLRFFDATSRYVSKPRPNLED